MKKGRSRVLESNHTLILGWSDEMVPIIRQICLANESIGGAAIVILAERDKEDMETEIMRNEIQFKGSKIICRSGNPLLKHDLDKVALKSHDRARWSVLNRCRLILQGPSSCWPINSHLIKAMPVF